MEVSYLWTAFYNDVISVLRVAKQSSVRGSSAGQAEHFALAPQLLAWSAHIFFPQKKPLPFPGEA